MVACFPKFLFIKPTDGQTNTQPMRGDKAHGEAASLESEYQL
jgi:hypothetical protein